MSPDAFALADSTAAVPHVAARVLATPSLYYKALSRATGPSSLTILESIVYLLYSSSAHIPVYSARTLSIFFKMCNPLSVSSFPNAVIPVSQHSFDSVPRHAASPEPISPKPRQGRPRKLSLGRSRAHNSNDTLSPVGSDVEDVPPSPLLFRPSTEYAKPWLYNPGSYEHPYLSRSSTPHSRSPTPTLSAPRSIKESIEHLGLLPMQCRAPSPYPPEQVLSVRRCPSPWAKECALPPIPPLPPAKDKRDEDLEFASPITPESAGSSDSGSSCIGASGHPSEPSPTASTFTITSTESNETATNDDDFVIDCKPHMSEAHYRSKTPIPVAHHHAQGQDKSFPLTRTLPDPCISVIPATPRTPGYHHGTPNRAATAPADMRLRPEGERSASPSPSLALSFSRLGLRRMASKTLLFGRKAASASDLHARPSHTDLVPREAASARTSIDTVVERLVRSPSPTAGLRAFDARTVHAGYRASAAKAERCSVELATMTDRGEIRVPRTMNEVIPTLRSFKIPSHIPF
ncbi:hypothetical protein OBBRIDRAFT_327027 [Obba rivulosa]|uniref:Uncharacterized protein n=1 Tax=Obba rivulosa TaxID=1052685 RepID=A0A8E2DPF5_9APHY|nr:hypothetical protein OBBRIDRAFT_327027 [Obba rivulosa]